VHYNLAMNDVTRILSAIEQGDSNAAEELLPLVYQELRKLAAAKLSKEKTGHSLQPTVLVHEAYLRLVDVDQPQQWNGRGHFFAAAAEAMRRILVDIARRKKSKKHGGQLRRVSLDDDLAATRDREVDLLALDEALARLEQRWPDKANLVKLRYFAGLTIPEASRAIGVSRATGERYWTFAKAWLHLQLSNGEEQSGKI
jgi:RNA polymerase sigma factor (TIGR02999 family)